MPPPRTAPQHRASRAGPVAPFFGHLQPGYEVNSTSRAGFEVPRVPSVRDEQAGLDRSESRGV